MRMRVVDGWISRWISLVASSSSFCPLGIASASAYTFFLLPRNAALLSLGRFKMPAVLASL